MTKRIRCRCLFISLFITLIFVIIVLIFVIVGFIFLSSSILKRHIFLCSSCILFVILLLIVRGLIVFIIYFGIRCRFLFISLFITLIFVIHVVIIFILIVGLIHSRGCSSRFHPFLDRLLFLITILLI